MNYVGKQVVHKTLGDGIITAVDQQAVTVTFSSGKESRFIYPSCFHSFLKLLDPAAEEAAAEDIKRAEEEKTKKHDDAMRQELIRQISRTGTDAKESKDVVVPPFPTTEAFFDAYKLAIIREVTFLRTTGGKHQKVFDGKQAERRNGRYIYSFEAEEELNLPEGTAITIWSPQSDIAAMIEGCEDFTIIISTGTNLGLEIPTMEFSAEPWRLLQSLIDRLDAMRQAPSDIVRELICNGFQEIDFSGRKIAVGQDQAIQMSTSQPITFVWGPPGTGKTQTLAKIALTHIQKGNRVLMLSYSNVSVDGAILRVHQLADKTEPGVLVRYGYPRVEELKQHEYLTSYNYAIHRHPDLLSERRDLLAERRKLSRTSSWYVEIGKRLTAIRSTLAEEEKSAVLSAQFVATTVSKAFVDKTIWNHQFDVVIFDEASMAYIPQIVFSAGLAGKHFVCMGDFRQLPPIVQSDPQSILNADIFQYCGITHAVDTRKSHKWLCLLDTQYRMHPAIADFASKTMYHGLLKSASQTEYERFAIAGADPIRNAPIGFVDLSGMMSVCTKTADGSRVNPLSAFITFCYALQAVKRFDVGIITPYHAQSRLLHAMARDAEKVISEKHSISCATVHQFQGSEKDVIIYDAVDCYRMPYPGMPLTATANNYANRLFNVALTRAKGKFIGVSNIRYMEGKGLSKNLMFGKLMYQMKTDKDTQAGYEILNSQVNTGIMRFFTAADAEKALLLDIESAAAEIRIDIPGSLAEEAQFHTKLANLLKEMKSKGISVYIRAEQKRNLPTALKPFAIENAFVANPLIIIDKRISWFGMPASDAQFITEGHTVKTQYRPILRFAGSHTALSLFGFMEMNQTSDQSTTAEKDSDGNLITDNFANYVLSTVKCPSCHKPMRMKKNNKGKFFLACTGYPACNETALIEPDLVEKYFYRNGEVCQSCPKCNCSLEAKVGQYGLYIQCCGASRHKYKPDEI